jgi:hypothetical protein
MLLSLLSLSSRLTKLSSLIKSSLLFYLLSYIIITKIKKDTFFFIQLIMFSFGYSMIVFLRKKYIILVKFIEFDRSVRCQ